MGYSHIIIYCTSILIHIHIDIYIYIVYTCGFKFTSINKYIQYIWVFPKIGVSQNGWFIMVPNPIKMDDLGGKNHPYFWFNTHIYSISINSGVSPFLKSSEAWLFQASGALALLAIPKTSISFTSEIGFTSKKWEYVCRSFYWLYKHIMINFMIVRYVHIVSVYIFYKLYLYNRHLICVCGNMTCTMYNVCNILKICKDNRMLLVVSTACTMEEQGLKPQ